MDIEFKWHSSDKYKVYFMFPSNEPRRHYGFYYYIEDNEIKQKFSNNVVDFTWRTKYKEISWDEAPITKNEFIEKIFTMEINTTYIGDV